MYSILLYRAIFITLCTGFYQSNHHWKENESKGTSNRKFLSSWSSATSISSTSSTSTSDEESTNNGKYGMDEASSLDLCLYPTKAADVREVKVIYFRFPEDCCPKGWRWKYACSDAFLRTKVGQKWWAFRCYTNNLVDHKLFESFIIIMILGSSISLVIGYCCNIVMINNFFLLFFTLGLKGSSEFGKQVIQTVFWNDPSSQVRDSEYA